MSTSSDCRLVKDDVEDNDSVFLPSSDSQCTCSVEIEQPAVSRLKREHSQRHSQRSHRQSRQNSTRSNRSDRSDRSRQGSQKRHGSQRREGSQKKSNSQRRQGSERHHRQPSRHGSTKDKKRLLSEQKSDSSSVATNASAKPRRAVQIIITVAVLLTLMSIIIVAATLLMSKKMEEMVKNNIATHKPRTFPVDESFEDEEIKGRSSLLIQNPVSNTVIPNRSRSPAQNDDVHPELNQGSRTEATPLIGQSSKDYDLSTEMLTTKLFKLSTSYR